MFYNRDKTQTQKSPEGLCRKERLSHKHLRIITCWLEVGQLLKVRMRLSSV